MKICSYAPQLQIWCLTIGAHFIEKVGTYVTNTGLMATYGGRFTLTKYGDYRSQSVFPSGSSEAKCY
ncbi:hypothetical protein EFV10_20955 [Escherichia coli]|nr:hypothetical protein EFV10_20955 [Escherichia coli]RNJ31696.1 hypothetical protein EFV02_21325 [Escherichia coli]